MGLLFRKRFRLSKWLSLNLSKSGVGLSVGPPGAKLSMNQKRARMQLGIPGTGVSYRRDVSMPKEPDMPASPTPSPSRPLVRPWLLVIVGLLLLAIWLGGCGFAEWRDQTLRDVGEGRSHLDVSQIPAAGNGPTQTIEFRDNARRTIGYGRVR
jgi:hypothetical protein